MREGGRRNFFRDFFITHTYMHIIHTHFLLLFFVCFVFLMRSCLVSRFMGEYSLHKIIPTLYYYHLQHQLGLSDVSSRRRADRTDHGTLTTAVATILQGSCVLCVCVCSVCCALCVLCVLYVMCMGVVCVAHVVRVCCVCMCVVCMLRVLCVCVFLVCMCALCICVCF